MSRVTRGVGLTVLGLSCWACPARADGSPKSVVAARITLPITNKADYRVSLEDPPKEGEVPYLSLRIDKSVTSKLGDSVQVDDKGHKLQDCHSVGVEVTQDERFSELGCVPLEPAVLKRGADITYSVDGQLEKVRLDPFPVPDPEVRNTSGAATPKGDATPKIEENSCDRLPDDDPHWLAYCKGYIALKGLAHPDITPEAPKSRVPQHVKDGDWVLLVFDADGTPIAPLLQVDEDDNLLVVVNDPQGDVEPIKVTDCAVPEAVRVYDGLPKGKVGLFEAKESPKPPSYRLVMASHCSSSAGLKFNITRKPVGGGEVTTASVTVPTLALYRITIGLGLLFDFTRVDEWHASAVKGESVPVLTKDSKAEGLSAVGFVALRPYAVDTKRPRSRFWEAVAPAVGVSLSDPLSHVYAALLVEPLPGLGLLGGWHFHRNVTPSGGYAEGDRIPGGTFSTDKRWQDPKLKDFFVGAYLDSSILGSILGAFNQ